MADRPLWPARYELLDGVCGLAALGTISYGLYLIRQFNLTLVATAARRLLPDSARRR